MTHDNYPALYLYLFAAIWIVYGIYSFIKGKITYGIEGGDSEDDRTLTGNRAKLVSALLVVSGVVMFLSATIGLCMVIGAMLLPWLIGD